MPEPGEHPDDGDRCAEACWRRRRQPIADDADGQAGQRAGGGDPALGPWRARLAVEAGHAAERPQLDRRRADAVAPGDDGVGELVAEDRGEEGDDADDGRERTELADRAMAARSTATTIALQWILSAAPASRPREIDPVSIVVHQATGAHRGG